MVATTTAKAKKDSSTSRFFIKVLNDDAGWRIINGIRKSLNRDRYSIVLKGNGPRQGPGYYSCNREDWVEIRVYLNVKKKVEDRELVYRKRWEMKRKLWDEELRYKRECDSIRDSYSWWLQD